MKTYLIGLASVAVVGNSSLQQNTNTNTQSVNVRRLILSAQTQKSDTTMWTKIKTKTCDKAFNSCNIKFSISNGDNTNENLLALEKIIVDYVQKPVCNKLIYPMIQTHCPAPVLIEAPKETVIETHNDGYELPADENRCNNLENKWTEANKRRMNEWEAAQQACINGACIDVQVNDVESMKPFRKAECDAGKAYNKCRRESIQKGCDQLLRNMEVQYLPYDDLYLEADDERSKKRIKDRWCRKVFRKNLSCAKWLEKCKADAEKAFPDECSSCNWTC